MSVVVGEFEVVPEPEQTTRTVPQAQQPAQTDAQRRHEVEAALRLVQSRKERLRAD